MDNNTIRQQLISRGEDPNKVDAFLKDPNNGLNQTNSNNPYAQGYLSRFLEPTAQLQQTQAATARTQAEQPGVVAESTLRAAQASQLSVQQDAADYFKNHSGKDGFVSPQDYNRYKAMYIGAGGDDPSFDKIFATRYVNPKNSFYDTPDAKIARSTLPVIKNIVDSYLKLDKTGPAWEKVAQTPLVGNLLENGGPLTANAVHNRLLRGQAGNIRQIAGAGPGQGFRFNLNELNNIIGMLPGGYDSKETANQGLDRLNSFLKDNMGVGLDEVMGGRQN